MPTNPAPSASFQAKLLPNRAPRKGVAIPKYDVKSIWEAIGFTPHAGQWEVYQGWLTHSVTTNVAGTRWGKSEFGAHLPLGYIAPCWKEVVQGGRLVKVDHYTTGAIVAPTYDLTGIIMGKLYSAVLKLCKILGYQPKAPGRTRHFNVEESDDGTLLDIDPEPGVLSVRKVAGHIRTIITPWGSRFDAFTMADPRGLLGKAFDWILTDESGQFDDMDWRNWFEYADRALIDREGWVYHGTTPKGFNALYFDFFIKGRPGPQRDLEYISFQQPTTRNTHLNADWIERKRKNTPPRLWAMNYLAQFSILDGQVYEEFSRDTHVRAFTPRAEWRFFLDMDFGFTDPFVAQLWAWTGEEFALIDEVYQANLTTRQQKIRVQAMLTQHLPRGAQWLAPGKGQWLVWGDPRGGQARAEWAALGVPIRKPNLHLRSGQKGSIEATAQVVAEYLHPIEDRPYPAWAKRPGDDLGAPRLIIHERCTGTIHSFQSWVKKGDSYDGDDHGCFPAGTLVTTDQGDVPIEEIRAGDRVLTSEGYATVSDSGITQAHAPLWAMTASDGSRLLATADHPVYVEGRGFVRLDALRYGDMLRLCPELKLSLTKTFGSGGTRTARITRTVNTTGQAPAIFARAWRPSTAKYSRTITAPSLTGGTFTTVTATLGTTTPGTCSASVQRSTRGTTRSITFPTQGTLNTWTASARWLQRGTAARKDARGTVSMLARSPRTEWLTSAPANTAAWRTTPCTVGMRASARTSARARLAGLQAWTTWSGSVLAAQAYSWWTATAAPRAAHVLAVWPTHAPAVVYNLTVDGVHEFYANGVLVHNCDAARYGILGARPYAVPLALLDERASRHQNQPGQRQRGPRKLPVRRLRDAKGNALSLGRR